MLGYRSLYYVCVDTEVTVCQTSVSDNGIHGCPTFGRTMLAFPGRGRGLGGSSAGSGRGLRRAARRGRGWTGPRSTILDEQLFLATTSADDLRIYTNSVELPVCFGKRSWILVDIT